MPKNIKFFIVFILLSVANRNEKRGLCLHEVLFCGEPPQAIRALSKSLSEFFASAGGEGPASQRSEIFASLL